MADKEKLVHVLRPLSSAIQFAAKPVIVKVGRPATVFHVNEERIAESSESFKAALKKEWPSGRSRIIQLPDEDAEIFNVYLNWLYARALPIGVTIDFKDVVTDAFIARIEGKSSADQNIYFPNSDCRVLLYQKTAPNSKLRQLLVHVMRQGEGSSGFLREEDTPTFLLDYAKADGSINALAHAAECGYHEHEKGDENCYRTKYATGSSMKVVNRL